MNLSPQRRRRRAQVAIELIVIVGAVIFFSALFFLALQNNNQEKIFQKQSIQLKEIARAVQNEIKLAAESMDGYSRNFEIPEKSGNLEYEIIIDGEIIYAKTTNGKHALALPIPTVVGDINKTSNIIKKDFGVIYLN